MQPTKLIKYLMAPASPAPLTTLRIVTGFLMFIGTLRFWYLGWIETNLLAAKFQFKYSGLEWVVMPTNSWMLYLVFLLLLLSALGVMLGYRYRLSAISLFLSFTYIELLDITWYLNHYYFISILLFLLALLPAHRHLSMDVYLKRVDAVKAIPSWMIALPRFQMGILYVYAGIAKIQYDWLIEAVPMRIWLPAHSHEPILGALFAWKYSPWIFSWIGMIYDCTIPFFLGNKRTRNWAYLSVVVFHSLTGWLFQIGMFPVVMMGITLVFFDAKIHEKIQEKWFHRHANLGTSEVRVLPHTLWIVGIFCLFQILFPWRFLLYSGKLFWTESGYRFSWRVMLMEKAGTATFYVTRSDTQKEGEIDNADFLLPHQEKQMAMQADLIVQYAHYLQSHFEKNKISVNKVRAEVYVTLQGKPSRLYFDPQLNLLALNHRKHPVWLYPAP